tara:strand:- start:281 stop:694 length:414 start_codon:yes stop_codon:yes gene_type:complete
MATIVLYDAYVSIAGVDLSDHVRSLTLDAGQSLQDDTAMGDTFQSNAAGLATWSVTIEFLQDYAASKVDATLEGELGIGNSTALIFNPIGSTTSSTNPKYSGTGVLESYNPISGSVGDQALATATFQSASALTRATS